MYSPEPSRKRLDISPTKFYALVDVMGPVETEPLNRLTELLDIACHDMAENVRDLAKTMDSLTDEARSTLRRRKNPFDRLDDGGDEHPLAGLRHSVGADNFSRVVFGVVSEISQGYEHLRTVTRGSIPGTVVLAGERIDVPVNFEQIQMLSYQIQMNEGVVGSFVSGVIEAEKTPAMVVEVGRRLACHLDAYHAKLIRRHSVEGIEIHGDPISTDLAMSIVENTDAHGEIEDGKDPDEISAYSVRKATIVAEAVHDGIVGECLFEPGRLIEFLTEQLRVLRCHADELVRLVGPLADKIRLVLGTEWDKPYRVSDHVFSRAVSAVKDLDPRDVVYKEKSGLLTAEERKELEFRNETLREVVKRLGTASADDIVRYVLRRKAELREYNLVENSFYVCRIGNGNMFAGEAPGGLSVVPGVKPVVDLSEVIGSGFREVEAFIGHTLDGAKWHDLFVATSPNKTADKSNILLVGPGGCGKTQALRAVAADRKSIGIFAQASDFLTCWKGEAEKNPKRLFEAGLRLQRESRKQVFFLIDEIDTILNGDRGQASFGDTNLATEFQVLMDGITSYPHLALWGATNAPERIPMPLIRRFAKVVIVGELGQADRVKLLRQYVERLPVAPGFPDTAWRDAAARLVGATGDVIRKVADRLWREKMSRFVELEPVKAESLVAILNEGSKFQVSTFTTEARRKFHEKLRPHVEVSPDELLRAVDGHLDNVAIRMDIETAVQTYERARQFLSGLKVSSPT